MSARIKVLPEKLANQIAAGEVVERPASVVKELVENSLDAGASRVTVEVQAGGVKLIKVADDGQGMGPDDALLAFERHATSKISDASGLDSITTLGFRGEAIPSIASVSIVRMTTSTGDGSPGTVVSLEGGKITSVRETGAPRGTAIEVSELFFNTPARLKFLKSRETEFSHIAATMEKVALSRPDVHFRLVNNGRVYLECPPVKRPKERVAQVYGRDYIERLVEAAHDSGQYRVSGFVSAPGESFADRGRQELFINGRPVKSPVVTKALYGAYRSVLMKDRHPASIIFLDMDTGLVDVNVHPAKREVRFSDNGAVHRAVFDAVSSALRQADEHGEPVSGAAYPQSQQTRVNDPYRDGIRDAVESFMSTASTQEDRYRVRYPEPVQSAMRLPAGKQHAPAYPAPDGRVERAPASRVLPVQVADSYIIIPAGDGYMVIDQHAAHERIQYEKVKASHGSLGPGTQGLLVPERLDLTAKEAALMDAVMPELAAIGIEVEHFGGTSFLIRSKPLFLDKVDIKEVVLGIISDLDVSDAKAGVEELREKVYQLMACKSAVKAGQRLHPEAMNRLVKQLFECEMPFTCAHGRPTAVKFGLTDLEKLFKRK